VSCGLRDVAEFETSGLPAVLVSTTGFIDAADEQAKGLGLAALRRLHLPHPIQNRTDPEMVDLARAAADELIEAISLV
jgi:hypothetical protein